MPVHYRLLNTVATIKFWQLTFLQINYKHRMFQRRQFLAMFGATKTFFFDDVSTSTAEFVGVLSQNMLFSFQLCFLCLGFVAHVS